MHIGLDAPDPKGHYTHSAAGRYQSPVSAVAVAWPKLSWPKPKSGKKLIFNSFGAEIIAVFEIRSVSICKGPPLRSTSFFPSLVFLPSFPSFLSLLFPFPPFSPLSPPCFPQYRAKELRGAL